MERQVRYLVHSVIARRKITEVGSFFNTDGAKALWEHAHTQAEQVFK